MVAEAPRFAPSVGVFIQSAGMNRRGLLPKFYNKTRRRFRAVEETKRFVACAAENTGTEIRDHQVTSFRRAELASSMS